VKDIVLLGDPELRRSVGQLLSEDGAPPVICERKADEAAWHFLETKDSSWLVDGMEFAEGLSNFAHWPGSLLVVTMRVTNPVLLFALNRVCLATNVTWVHAVLDGPFVFIGPTFVPGRTACYECLDARVMMNMREAGSYQRYKRLLSQSKIKVGNPPAIRALDNLLSSHTALEVLNFALTGATYTVNKLMAIYLPTMESTYTEVLRLPGCGSCGPVAERDSHELYFETSALLDTSVKQ
jgi:thiazole/oxazole-forming peptide maturase SagC family component